jgi:hypothetical protein
MAIPNKSCSVNVLAAYARRAAGEYLIFIRSTPIPRERKGEKSTFIRDVTRCG